MGKFGGALVFSGGYVTVPHATSLNLTTALTIEAWVFPTQTQNWGAMVMKEQPSNYVYVLYAGTPTKPSAEFNVSTVDAGQRTLGGPTALATNTWSHVASTYDGTTLRLYVNGAQVASQAIAGPIAASTGALRIGGNAIWGEYFAGRIDEVRIYNRALSVSGS